MEYSYYRVELERHSDEYFLIGDAIAREENTLEFLVSWCSEYTLDELNSREVD